MQPGEKVRYFRKKKGITQVELAKAAGLKQGNISDIERGRQAASREFVKKISGVLDLSANDIVDILGFVTEKGFRCRASDSPGDACQDDALPGQP